MEKIGPGKTFVFILLASIVPMFFLVRYFENNNIFDSIGTWYTIYVSVTFSFLPALLSCGIAWLRWK